MLYIFYFVDLQQIFKINKIAHNAHSNNGLGFFFVADGYCWLGRFKTHTP